VTPPRYVLIANPGTKRCETYCSELRAYWQARGHAVELEVVPWAAVAPLDGNLDTLPAFDRPAVVRMESPGKDDTATRLLLEAGARDDPTEPARDWRAVELPKGLILRPGLLYRGFKRVLTGLRRSFDARPHLRPTACPLAVAHMFDKLGTALTLGQATIPIPNMLTFEPADAQVLRGAVIACGWPTAYVKLNTGSSATGIIHLHPHADEPFGVTTLADIGGGFYNSRLVHRIGGPALDSAITFLLREGVFVQRGIPMAQIDGQNFDVRVVCVNAKPTAVIFRLSPHPMTNLHLGGRRGDYARCRAAIPTREWLDALDHCADAAACFDSTIAGVDLLFERGFRRHYILEVNAFGDFFPGWTDDRGRSIHAIEIEATAAAVTSSG
jgi:hypothetical protein